MHLRQDHYYIKISIEAKNKVLYLPGLPRHPILYLLNRQNVLWILPYWNRYLIDVDKRISFYT